MKECHSEMAMKSFKEKQIGKMKIREFLSGHLREMQPAKPKNEN